jgi:SAM-dependent methyltransferase
MPGGPSLSVHDELARIRQEYEDSTSWRVTRPLRAAGRLARRLQPGGAGSDPIGDPGTPPGSRPGGYDAWLRELFGDQLDPIERACADGPSDDYSRFRGLDDDVWALLLSKEFACYPNILAFLPDVPDPAVQQLWNGTSGIELAAQGSAFYTKVKARFGEHAQRPLADARVLDFGCGWGRLTRFFARDVAPGSLLGCDPVQGIVDACRRSRVPARFERSEFVPERLPFEDEFTLAFAFSVFTHLSEPAHLACLRALHGSLAPDALLILTIRPTGYLSSSAELRQALESFGGYPALRRGDPLYLFAPHEADAGHPQYGGEAMHYGETVVMLEYVRQRWSDMFELVEVDFLISDPQQVMVTLRARG